MNPSWIIRTGRLLMRPVSHSDLADLRALKSDPLVFAVMLGGVRGTVAVADELAVDIQFWGAHSVGMWAVRDARSEAFLGLVGLHARPDGRGMAIRFAMTTASQGRGYATEAAGAALRFAHDRAGIGRVVAVARANNIGSRQVLGGIGMVECDIWERDGELMLMYESGARQDLPTD
jgi:RimJ/RimL family protein N-acetyltransferase